MTGYSGAVSAPQEARPSSCESTISGHSSGEENSTVESSINGESTNSTSRPEAEAEPRTQTTEVIQATDDEEPQFGSSENLRKDNQFVISWSNLDYVIDSKWYKLSSNRKPILNGLSGCFASGQLSAILGPSGAGKSSLVDCLLGIKNSRSLSGAIRVNFNNPQLDAERRRKEPLRIALIPQEDHLLDSLTVMETFMFASKIKNSHLSNGRPFDHLANVQRVLRQLNLTSCAKTRCGKLSGGQYKRVSIGQELLSRPEFMILDEPTSGLDSVTCYQTVKALRDLIDASEYPIAIVATIHQPDREVFSLFHKAYVLATGGRVIYEGPTDCIVESIQTGIELVEARRKQPFWQLTANSGKNNPVSQPEAFSHPKTSITSNNLSELNHQLMNDLFCNPARVIVEVAANEYGFELISALNEMQKASHLESMSRQQLMPLEDKRHSFCSSNLYLDEIRSVIRDTQTTSTFNAISRDPTILQQSEKSNHLSKWTLPDKPDMDPYQTKFNLNSSFQSLLGDSKSIMSRQSVQSFDYESNRPKQRRAEQDSLLNLRKCNINQRRSLRVHLKHVYYHMHRSWITILRDPMLFMLMVILHVSFPLLISYTFYNTYKADACPSVGPFDVLEEAYRTDESNVLMDLNREIRATFENLGYMFFQIYVIIFAGVCVTSLTYPLVMHVLVKEFRNGWYSITSYFIGRTLADLPVPTLNVFIAMAISYHLTGQPHSPYCWRFLCVAGLTILATLVAQTQGLMFGALLMNLPQSAVFVAPASTAPLVIVSGFLIRVANLPWILQLFSKVSFFSHLLNGFVVARYGFGRCGECNETLFANNNVPRIPDQARVIIDFWAETYASEYGASNVTETRLVDKLVNNIASAKMFGRQIEDCSQFKPFTMLDFDLEDYHLYVSFAILAIMLVFFRWLTYLVLHWKIRSSI